MATDGKAKQNTRGSVQETVPSGECAGEDSGIDDVWEDMDPSTVDGNDVRTKGKENQIRHQAREASDKPTSRRRCQSRAIIPDRYRGRACQ